MSEKSNDKFPHNLREAKLRARREWAQWKAETDPKKRGYDYWYDRADEWELAAEYDTVERDWT